jgi:outer membrane lipoprotein-sorting protein
MRPFVLLLALFALVAPTVRAAEDTQVGDGLTARGIYDKVLSNRFERFRQEIRLISGDRAENAQESRMTVLWKSFRDEKGQPRKGVLSKTMVRYTHPFDLRFSGYLVINNADRLDDQFVYLASRRRTHRVNLRGEPVLGSDFSFEDVIPHEIEDADYKRRADTEHDARPCFVIEIYPKPEANSEYSKLESRVDRERFVVLRTQYWNKDGVLIKELDAPAEEVKEFSGIWIPMHTEMRNLVSESWSKLYIDKLEANPDVPDTDFDPRKLESH